MGVSYREEFVNWMIDEGLYGWSKKPYDIQRLVETAYKKGQSARESEGGKAVAYACHSCGDKTSPPAPFSMSVKCHCGHTTAATIAANLAKDTHLPKQQSGVPELTSGLINDCCWTFVESMPHHLPGPIFNDLKPALYAAIKEYHQKTFLIPQPDKWIPELDSDLRWILGRPNFACAPLAQTLRKMGHEVERKAEDEQAAAIHWMLELYAKHGADWRKEAEALLSAAHKSAEQESE